MTVFITTSTAQYTILSYILVLWSSSNFCNISQNMHSKAPVASQHEKTNKVVWTCKYDWPPWRTSTYERPLTWEGNYLVLIVISVSYCCYSLGFSYVIWKDLIFRWSVQIQIYPPISDELNNSVTFSDEVHTETQSHNELIFSDKVFRFRYTPQPTGISWQRMVISDFYCYSSYRKINWQTYPPQTYNKQFEKLIQWYFIW